MNKETPEAQQSYEVVSVRCSDPPPGTEGTNWHRYVISFGSGNCIQGCRQGDLGAVTEAVEEIVVQMNERRRGKRGRVHLVSTPKKTATNKEKTNLS